jgi:WD40 repeat protein
MSIQPVTLGLALFCLALQIQSVAAQNAEMLFRHEGPVRGLAFSPGGKLLAAVGERTDKTGEVILWEVATGKRLMRLQGHPSVVEKVAFLSAGKILATSCNDRLLLWDVETGKILSRRPGVHVLGEKGVGRIVDDSCQVWDLAKKKPARTCDIPGARAQRVTLSADGEQLAVLVAGGVLWRVVVLNVVTLTERISFSLVDTGEVESLAFSPDKQLLAVGSGNALRLWDLSSGKLRGELAATNGAAEV